MADTERAGYKDRFRKTRLKNNAADIAKHTESQGHFYSGITSRVKPRMNQRNNTGARRNDEIGNPNLKPSPPFLVQRDIPSPFILALAIRCLRPSYFDLI